MRGSHSQNESKQEIYKPAIIQSSGSNKVKEDHSMEEDTNKQVQPFNTKPELKGDQI